MAYTVQGDGVLVFERGTPLNTLDMVIERLVKFFGVSVGCAGRVVLFESVGGFSKEEVLSELSCISDIAEPLFGEVSFSCEPDPQFGYCLYWIGRGWVDRKEDSVATLFERYVLTDACQYGSDYVYRKLYNSCGISRESYKGLGFEESLGNIEKLKERQRAILPFLK